jgi:hypothetical protein
MESSCKTIVAVALLTLCCGCAAAPVQLWQSLPARQTVADPNLRVELEPLKQDKAYFSSFRLTIQNTSAKPVAVDWNDTRYLHKGQDLGPFVFRGIDPATIQGQIPPTVIPPGEALALEIFPLRTIAFLPRSDRPDPGRLGFMPGILPAGENGILLVVKQDEQQLRQTLSLRLRAETVP